MAVSTRSIVGILVAGSGCGWRFGVVDASYHVSSVTSRAVDPGLASGLRGALVRELAERGVRDGGLGIDVTVRDADHAPEASVSGGGVVAFVATVTVEARVPDRPGCEVVVGASVPWADRGGEDLVVAADRAVAVDRAADDIAARIVDAILGDERCR